MNAFPSDWVSSSRRLLTTFLAVAVFAGNATSADITATPPAGGGFVVTNADQSAERLRVSEDGSVTVPGTVQLNGTVKIDGLRNNDYVNAVGDILVCLNVTTGRLSRCSPPPYMSESLGRGPIYVKKVVYELDGSAPSLTTFTTVCDASNDKAIAGTASVTEVDDNIIRSMQYEDNYFRVLLATGSVIDELVVTLTCMRTQ